MRFKRCGPALAALALLLTGCSLGAARVEQAPPSAAAGSRVPGIPDVAAPGVRPCSDLPVKARTDDVKGASLPSLSLPCLTGGPDVNLSRLGGPVIVNLWATWCTPCREEMPALQDTFERYGNQVRFVGVDTKDDPHSAAAFLADVGVTYPQLVDPDGQLLADLRIPGLPVTVALDADGRVIKRHVGPLTRESLRALAATMSATAGNSA